MEKGRGSEESEACPRGTDCLLAGSMWDLWVHLLQQYFLQKARAGVKQCQPSLRGRGGAVDSQVMGLRGTLSDIQCSPHRSGAFSS